MDKVEAREIAKWRAADLRSQPYASLVANYLNQSIHDSALGTDGVRYDVEVQAFWDAVRQPGNLRVMVDDGRRKGPHRVVTEDFILAPDGTFVGE